MSLFLALAALYIGMGGLIWAFQDRLIFPVQELPEDLLTEFAIDRAITPVRIPTDDGLALYGWHNNGNNNRAVILFHGNAATLAGAWPIHQYLRARNWDVLAFAYRGYPGSPGRPSQHGIQRDSRAIWRYATHTLGYAPSRLILHGRSLGGGAVGTIMNEVTPAGIVLQSTFRSVRSIATSNYPIFPVRWLLNHPFDTEANASTVQVPVLVLHSRDDEIIPAAHGQRLAERFPSARYVEVQHLGHNEDLIVIDSAASFAYDGFIESLVPIPSKHPE